MLGPRTDSELNICGLKMYLNLVIILIRSDNRMLYHVFILLIIFPLSFPSIIIFYFLSQ